MNDQSLGQAFRKPFKVIAPDDVQPSTKNWKVLAPPADSTSPLEVRFAESLDHGMLERVLQVKNATGEIIDGKIEISKFETLWKLTPKSPWKPGEYSLDVDTDLEDLAGNSVAKPFEVDVFKKVQRNVVPKIQSVNFSIGAKD